MIVPVIVKERHRRQLMDGNFDVQLVYLKGGYHLIWSCLEMRKDHYMKPHMLKSQLEPLEEPISVLSAEISLSVDEILRVIATQVA